MFFSYSLIKQESWLYKEHHSNNSRGYTHQLYLGKCEVFLGKVAFSRVGDFTSGKLTQASKFWVHVPITFITQVNKDPSYLTKGKLYWGNHVYLVV